MCFSGLVFQFAFWSSLTFYWTKMLYLSWVEGWIFGNEYGLSIQTSNLFLFEAPNGVKEPRKRLTGKWMMIGLRIKETQICTQITNSKTKELYQWFGLHFCFWLLKKIQQNLAMFHIFFLIFKLIIFFFQFNAEVAFCKHSFLAMSASCVPAITHHVPRRYFPLVS